MTLVQIIDRNDAARALITEIGEESLVHFRDKNGETPLYKRAFSDGIKRCEEMSRRLLGSGLHASAHQMAAADGINAPRLASSWHHQREQTSSSSAGIKTPSSWHHQPAAGSALRRWVLEGA